MIVNMSDSATEQQIEHIIQRIREAGFQPHVTRGTERTIVARRAVAATRRRAERRRSSWGGAWVGIGPWWADQIGA